MDSALTERIRAWLVEYLAQPGLQHELRDVAAFGALPLYSDVGGCIAIRPDGRVVQIFWNRPEASFSDAPANWRIAALVAGSAHWPELRQLLPARPEGAPPCANCEGKGALDDGVICGVCFGLGFTLN
jgi:hypothetical protein